MKFPTGGTVRDPWQKKCLSWLTRCKSGTNSKVWMKEETVRLPFCEVRALWVLPQRGIREMRENGHPGTFCSGDFCGVFTRKKNLPFRILHAADAAEREEKMNNLLQSVTENVTYVLSFLGIIVLMFAAALMLEKAAMKKNGTKGPIFHTRKIAMIGMFSAIAMILHLFDFPLPFAPDFYKLDFSELPILVGTFAFGPAAGVMMEFVKILLKLMVKGTSTAFVGDLANFVIGCSFILPASVVYAFRKNKKTAVIACITGTLIMTVFGTAFNAIYLLPAFSELYHLPLENILAMGSAVNPLMTEGSIVSFVAACVAPMNLIKGVSVSVVTLLIYKPLSPIIKNGHR